MKNKYKFLAELGDLLNNLSWVEIHTKYMSLCIEKRPNYCDRGRYIVKVDPLDLTKCHVDYADGFPRYYFELHCMLIEIEHFIRAKKQKIQKVEFKSLDATSEPQIVTDFI